MAPTLLLSLRFEDATINGSSPNLPDSSHIIQDLRLNELHDQLLTLEKEKEVTSDFPAIL
ncbi:hypothetical protein LguiA_013250 [Lonicera macranthoides]